MRYGCVAKPGSRKERGEEEASGSSERERYDAHLPHVSHLLLNVDALKLQLRLVDAFDGHLVVLVVGLCSEREEGFRGEYQVRRVR